jgi:hypothetical protein
VARGIKPIVRIEDLDDKMRRLVEVMAESGREAGEEARAIARERGDVWRARPVPREIEKFVAAARRALEDEITIAAEVAAEISPGENFIRLAERDHEVAKRALVNLKLPQLRRLAENLGLSADGTQNDVVDRIAREYSDDSSEIARLVLAYEEARPERGLVDRLYAVREPMTDVSRAAAIFNGLAGRYIRVGIARWFVFNHARTQETGDLWLDGLYRAYSADAKREGDNFELVSVPSDAHVTARLREDQRFIEVRARGDAESRAIVTALEWATSLRHAAAFPLEVSAPEGQLMGWDHRSIFLLYFLDRRLPDQGISIINLTSARFESASPHAGYSRSPNVRSVALHGQHLLSSKAACDLLIEGRALTELSLDVRFRPRPDREFVLPIRISLGRDHLSLLTGFGSYSPETAAELHREVMRRLRRTAVAGVTADDRLQSLINQIEMRARSTEPVDTADIFAPPDDWRPPSDEDD